MPEDLQQQVLSRIDALAAKLGVAAEHLWPALVRYSLVKNLAIVALWAFGLVVLFRSAKRLREDGAADWDDFFGSFMRPVGIGLLALTVAIVGMVEIPDAISGIAFPEVSALRSLLP